MGGGTEHPSSPSSILCIIVYISVIFPPQAPSLPSRNCNYSIPKNDDKLPRSRTLGERRAREEDETFFLILVQYKAAAGASDLTLIYLFFCGRGGLGHFQAIKRGKGATESVGHHSSTDYCFLLEGSPVNLKCCFCSGGLFFYTCLKYAAL